MLDTLAVAQRLAAGGVDRDQAEVIADAIRQAVEQGDYVTSGQFEAGIAKLRTELRTEMAEMRTEQRTQAAEMRTEMAEMRTEMANLETRLVRWMIGTVIATATLTVAIVRLLGLSTG